MIHILSVGLKCVEDKEPSPPQMSMSLSSKAMTTAFALQKGYRHEEIILNCLVELT